MGYRQDTYSWERVWISRLARFAAVLIVLNLLAACVYGVARSVLGEPPKQGDSEQTTDDDTSPKPPSSGDGDVPAVGTSVILGETADQGQSYIDEMIFFGESTTAHLRSRGVLRDGVATKQVWADSSNTMMLSPEILQKKIIYPETGASMSVDQAAAIRKPRYLVLAFGVNGLSGFAANRQLYAKSYEKLISAVKTASPETTIILQTVYPVAENYNDASSVNAKIAQLNAWLPDIAAQNGVHLVDTASVLTDEDGMLRSEYAMGDGLHLTKTAYVAILQYLRTHGCPK